MFQYYREGTWNGFKVIARPIHFTCLISKSELKGMGSVIFFDICEMIEVILFCQMLGNLMCVMVIYDGGDNHYCYIPNKAIFLVHML